MIEMSTIRETMKNKASIAYSHHKSACETWTHGGIAKIWLDNTLTLCIEYQDGNWWHYNDQGTEWW